MALKSIVMMCLLWSLGILQAEHKANDEVTSDLEVILAILGRMRQSHCKGKL